MNLFFVFIILLEKASQRYIVLDLYKDNEELNQIKSYKMIKDEEVMNILFYNDIYTLINVGKPKKEIKFYLTFTSNETLINNKEYSASRSLTYKRNNITNESIDYFELNERKQNKTKGDYSFILLDINENKNKKINDNKCIIGLKPLDIKFNANTNFLFQFQKFGYIDKRIFSIIIDDIMIYENNIKKEKLLVGALPEEMNSEMYSKNGIKWTKISNNNRNKDNQKWEFYIDSFAYNDYKNNGLNYTYIEFILENNLIIAPNNFRLIILNDFLNQLINDNICNEDYFYNEREQKPYIYYACQEYKNFSNKVIYFKNKDLNDTFEINLGELFYTYNQKYYFGIIFNAEKNKENKDENIWKMGKLFFGKYSFVFDDEKKRIGYYRIEKEDDKPYIILICFAIFIIFVIILAIISNKANIPKRKKVSNNKEDFLSKKENDNNASNEKINKNEKEKIE